MSYVPLEKMIEKSRGSMYKLVTLVSKRALALAEGATRLVEAPQDIKVTTLAMQELAEGKYAMGEEASPDKEVKG